MRIWSREYVSEDNIRHQVRPRDDMVSCVTCSVLVLILFLCLFSSKHNKAQFSQVYNRKVFFSSSLSRGKGKRDDALKLS